MDQAEPQTQRLSRNLEKRGTDPNLGRALPLPLTRIPEVRIARQNLSSTNRAIIATQPLHQTRPARTAQQRQFATTALPHTMGSSTLIMLKDCYGTAVKPTPFLTRERAIYI